MPRRIDHDVPRFDVPVDDPLFVSVIQRIGHLPDDRQHSLKIQCVFATPAFDPAPQVFALDTFHDEVIIPVGVVLFQIIGTGDIGMVQIVNQLEILLDVFHFQRVMRKFRRQGFQGDFNPRRFIETFVNHAHAPLTEFGQDFIAFHNQIAGLEPSIRFAVPFSRHGLIISNDLVMRSPRRHRFIRIIHFSILSCI